MKQSNIRSLTGEQKYVHFLCPNIKKNINDISDEYVYRKNP